MGVDGGVYRSVKRERAGGLLVYVYIVYACVYVCLCVCVFVCTCVCASMHMYLPVFDSSPPLSLVHVIGAVTQLTISV